MVRFQFSLLGLFGLTTALGLACAAMVQASLPWCTGMFLATALLLFTAVLLAVLCRGTARAFWLGFAVFGWGFLTVLYGPFNQLSRSSDIIASTATNRFVDELWLQLYVVSFSELPGVMDSGWNGGTGPGGVRGMPRGVGGTGGGFFSLQAGLDDLDAESDGNLESLQAAIAENAAIQYPRSPWYFVSICNMFLTLVVALIGGIMGRASCRE